MSGTLKSSVKLSHFGFFMLSASSDQFEINKQQFICFLLLFPDGQTIKNANSSQIRLINEHCKSQLSSLWDTADLPAGTGAPEFSWYQQRAAEQLVQFCPPQIWRKQCYPPQSSTAACSGGRGRHRRHLCVSLHTRQLWLCSFTNTPSELQTLLTSRC